MSDRIKVFSYIKSNCRFRVNIIAVLWYCEMLVLLKYLKLVLCHFCELLLARIEREMLDNWSIGL